MDRRFGLDQMANRKASVSEYVRRILQLRRRLGLNRSEFAARLNYSAMALSRRENDGRHDS
jgi:transcriptional regulator with XRE-family HTH domain